MFRIGPPVARYGEELTAHPDQQFPVEAFEAFAAQWVPRWADHEAMTLAAHESLLARIGPSVLIAQSQGGGLALTLSARQTASLKAVIALEPSGAPSQVPDGGALPPHLVVWGDRVHAHPVWRNYRSRVDAHLKHLRGQGVVAETLDLPKQGLHGNSHFPMLDRNSDQVLEQVMRWLAPLIDQPSQETTT